MAQDHQWKPIEDLSPEWPALTDRNRRFRKWMEAAIVEGLQEWRATLLPEVRAWRAKSS